MNSILPVLYVNISGCDIRPQFAYEHVILSGWCPAPTASPGSGVGSWPGNNRLFQTPNATADPAQ